MQRNSSVDEGSGNDDTGGGRGMLQSLGLPPPGELLPLGYLYLLILGIASESIRFGLMGVNVLDYSNVLDVLLSPIALVTGEIFVLAVVFVLPLLLWPYLKFMRWLAGRTPNGKNAKLREKPLGEIWLPVCAVALFFAFLGLGLGQGTAQSEKLRAGELVPDTRLLFSDGESVDAYVVGINSGYVFYVEPEATEVAISPIADNLRSLRALATKDD